jgi:uncharacterized membrane protein
MPATTRAQRQRNEKADTARENEAARGRGLVEVQQAAELQEAEEAELQEVVEVDLFRHQTKQIIREDSHLSKHK